MKDTSSNNKGKISSYTINKTQLKKLLIENSIKIKVTRNQVIDNKNYCRCIHQNVGCHKEKL